MPRATVSNEATRYDLKSCPGGFVMLKPLPYGQLLQRRDRAGKMLQKFQGKRKANDVSEVEIVSMMEAARQFDFAHCIDDHNLEDDNGKKLDFNNPIVLQVLDPRIATEIELLMDNLNGEDFDEELFTSQSDPSSETQMNGSSTDSE